MNICTHPLNVTTYPINIIFQCEIYIIKSLRRHLSLSIPLSLFFYFFSCLFVLFPYAAQVLAPDRIIQEIIRIIIITTTTTIIIISMVKEMVTAVNRSIQIKYLAIPIVDHHNRINHGKIYLFLHQIQRLVVLINHNNLAAASIHRHQTNIRLEEIRIQAVLPHHIRYHLHLACPHRILHTIFIRGQQLISQVCWINFCTTNKADDEMPLQQCMLIGNNLHTLSFLAFVISWLDSY